jgi:putative transposase
VAEALNYTRQHYYKQKQDLQNKVVKEGQVKALALAERKLLPRVGTRKIYHLIEPALRQQGLKFGRDKLFKLLRENDLLIKPGKRYTQTTNSKHWLRKYPNTAKDLVLTAPEQLWVSDITYIKTEEGNCYLSMITDAYSRKIMGYSVADNMEASTVAQALKMAIKNRIYTNKKLIHHSDRGLQYCSSEYVLIADANQIKMSMTEQSDPYENALAERMNRTIKEEFCLDRTLKTKSLVFAVVNNAVELYNNYRPHQSLSLKTPNQIHQKTQPPEAVGSI